MANLLRDKIYQINCLTEDIDSIYHQAARALGVSDSVLFILYTLHTNDGECPLYAIYKSSGISKQTINSAIRKLEKEGILYLEKLNGKSKTVKLTENGKSYTETTAGRLLDAECNAFCDWPTDEIDLYLHLMEKYNISLRKQIKKLSQSQQKLNQD